MDDRTGDRRPDPRRQAEFIELMTRDLSIMALNAGLPMLAYVLDMAREEASLAKNATDIRLAPLETPGRKPHRVSLKEV
jgi:hypothetical protein